MTTHARYNGKDYPFPTNATKERKKRRTTVTWFERVKLLYEKNGEFRLNCELLAVITFSLIAAVSIVTALFFVV